jgi:uncharacterized protein (TIGR02996 family)
MNEEDTFIRAILANPSDNALRLVYADWLEERNDARGQYLRLLVAEVAEAVDGREALLTRLEHLRVSLDPSWTALMLRGRQAQSQPTESKSKKEGKSRRERLQADVGLFLQQYARKGGNDRCYSRKIEGRVQRMKPEELDELIRGEE